MDKYDVRAMTISNRLSVAGTQERYDSIIADALRDSAVEELRDSVTMLEKFHGKRCRPIDGECACKTKKQQGILNRKMAAIRAGRGEL